MTNNIVTTISNDSITYPPRRKTLYFSAAWSSFKTMLRYKCENAKVLFEEVSERFTTQICSSCGEITASSPKDTVLAVNLI